MDSSGDTFADSFALPSADDQGETLEQLNSPCPWMMDTPPTPDASDTEDNVSVYWAPRHSPFHEISGSPTAVPLTDSPLDERTPLVGMPTNGKVALAALLEQIERQYIQRPAAMSSVPPIST